MLSDLVDAQKMDLEWASVWRAKCMERSVVLDVSWSRVIDMNDRSLRNTIIGLGENSVRENSYDITVASEVMAIFCLSNSLSELNDRLGNIIIGHTLDKKEIKAKDLKATDAMTALLKNAFMPNVV